MRKKFISAIVLMAIMIFSFSVKGHAEVKFEDSEHAPIITKIQNYWSNYFPDITNMKEVRSIETSDYETYNVKYVTNNGKLERVTLKDKNLAAEERLKLKESQTSTSNTLDGTFTEDENSNEKKTVIMQIMSIFGILTLVFIGFMVYVFYLYRKKLNEL